MVKKGGFIWSSWWEEKMGLQSCGNKRQGLKVVHTGSISGKLSYCSENLGFWSLFSSVTADLAL